MIATPKCYTSPPSSATQRTDLQLDLDIPMFKICKGQCLELPLTSNYDTLAIDPAVAMNLKPVEIKAGVSIATVTGKLDLTNHKYRLDENDSDKSESTRSAKRQKKLPKKDNCPDRYLFGKITISNLLQNLAAHGISTLKTEEPGPGQYIIHLVSYYLEYF